MPLPNGSTQLGEMIALNATRDSQKALWRTKLTGAIRSSAAYAEGKLYIGDDAGALSCLDAKSGRVGYGGLKLP